MPRLFCVLSSTIGQKYLMGVTGLLLCGFLATHLAGNLLIFQGQEAYNAYEAKLHAFGPLLWAAEIGLLALFVVHLILAVTLTVANRRARGRDGYEVKESKQDTSVLNAAPRSWMFVSGSVVLVFLVYHVAGSRFGLMDESPTLARLAIEEGSVEEYGAAESRTGLPAIFGYERMVAILRSPVSAVVYLIGLAFLGFHLSHGFASAFRSLGIAHPIYTPWIYRIGLAFAVVISVGFASIPIWIWAFNVQVPSPMAPVDPETANEALEALIFHAGGMPPA
ncbi:MAG: succinate dehydrogenase cytochrome b subunit [Planctomycetaceae bacterium]|nr:succinate dehydrogenase cytochrome b subunit [Planctomycetaceae bacterium]